MTFAFVSDRRNTALSSFETAIGSPSTLSSSLFATLFYFFGDVIVSEKARRLAVIILVSVGAGVGAWAVLHYNAPKQRGRWGTANYPSNFAGTRTEAELWAEGIEKVKADRGEPVGAVEVPPELRHYSDTHWFLATQVAEIRKYNIQSSQDFIDLATM